MPESEANEEQDPELLFRDARAQFEQATELQRRLADLEGRAESSDSRVKATYNQERGLADLQLDPRALRMGSDELRQTILEVSYEAKRDLERQTKEILDESFAEWDLTPEAYGRGPQEHRADTGGHGQDLRGCHERGGRHP